MVLDISGSAWRNGSSALGLPASTTEYVSENAPKEVKPQDLGAPPGVRFVHTACGRNHTLLVGSCGTMWVAGANTLGQVRVVFVLF